MKQVHNWAEQTLEVRARHLLVSHKSQILNGNGRRHSTRPHRGSELDTTATPNDRPQFDRKRAIARLRDQVEDEYYGSERHGSRGQSTSSSEREELELALALSARLARNAAGFHALLTHFRAVVPETSEPTPAMPLATPSIPLDATAVSNNLAGPPTIPRPPSNSVPEMKQQVSPERIACDEESDDEDERFVFVAARPVFTTNNHYDGSRLVDHLLFDAIMTESF